MTDRLNSLHNKTQVVADSELPYNPLNKLLGIDDLRKLFDLNGLQDVEFNNVNLYRNAFVHRSYATMKNSDFETGNERCPPDCLPLQEMSYERLEFLGDAILGMVVARYLYERFPDQPEGFLSRIRTKIVNGKTLGFLGNTIGLTPFMIISKQIENANGRDNYKIMEDCFEAFIGALYMDFQNDDHVLDATTPQIPLGIVPGTGIGYYVAEQWIIHIIETHLDFSEMIASRTNYKDMLVRYMQHTFQDAPRFLEMSVNMVRGQKVFTYCVKDKATAVIGVGKGASKKEAENEAALAALQRYGAPIG